jgi:flagellar basal body-associated protein FliL
MKHNISQILMIFVFVNALIILVAALPASAMTLNDVLAGIGSIRKPATLTSISFMADMTLDVSSVNNTDNTLAGSTSTFLAQWRSPDSWKLTFQSGDQPVGMLNPEMVEHPVASHTLFARPDFIDILSKSWTFEYQGSALWDGSPAWQLLVKPSDINSKVTPFYLYVRKDDFVPLRAEMTTPEGIEIVTDMTWMTIDSVTVPSKFSTVFSPPLGPLEGVVTTFYNHQINPDLSAVVFPREEVVIPIEDSEPDDEPAVFEELYHGFADDPLVSSITDSSGTYDRISYTFSLYVEDRVLMKQLNKRHKEILDLVVQAMSGHEWSGEKGLSTPDGKYQAGKDILAAIGKILSTDKITDFYFLTFKPLKPGE